MSDTAAFFAKKKKKKAFKFNANVIDVAQITSSIHVYVYEHPSVFKSMHIFLFQWVYLFASLRTVLID
jgi:hypothetical protein